MALALAYEFVGRVLVYVGGPVSPEQRAWDKHIAELEAHAAKHPDTRSLVWSGGANLPPSMRKQLSDAMPKTSRTAVLTESTVDRGIVTALSWFIDGIKAFSPDDEARAVAYLGLTPAEANAVLPAGKRLRAEIAASVGFTRPL